MPVQKGVLPLGILCIKKITQLLIDIVSMCIYETIKERKSPENTKEQQVSSHEKNQHYVNTKLEMDHDQKRIEQEEACAFNRQNTELDGTHGNGQQKTEEENVHSHAITAEDTNKQPIKSDNIDEHEIHEVIINDENAAKLENNQELLYGCIRCSLETENTANENIEKEIQLERTPEALRQELSQLLTSHSHVTLHGLLFDSIMTHLDPIYMRDKRGRPAVLDIIMHFINSTLRELDFGKAKMFSEANMCKILFEHLQNATRLEKLIIGRSCYWRSQIFENLSSKLICMPHLTVLKIQYIGTPEMICDLSGICPKLSELSLRGSEKITDQQCKEIAQCTGLTSLDISGTRITGRGCWKILDSVKNLSWLHHCAFNCNSDSLLFESRADLFNCIKEQLYHGENALSLVNRPDLSIRDVRFNLKNFWLFNPFTEDLLTTVLCPYLEHLRLDFIFQDLEDEPDVSTLASLSEIRKLEANLYDRCSLHLISNMVESCGERLTTLLLHLADDWFFVAQAHNVVASCCPNLVTLNFSGDYKARHSVEECDDRLDFGIPTPAHPHLKHLKLIGVISDRRLHFILSHTPALETLRMDGELEWLHDATFTAVLKTNPLPYLEEMWFNVSTTVTLDTVRLLLTQDNALRHIGRLCHMAGATMGEYQELLSQVRQQNLDVKLIWVTDERIK
nr:uncharacterized protein LOC123757966 [Procambarus clarkii]XP_045597927.1 uncharacterized protein LOC123757966 [Procambarus clarkii]XP_045597928.1 uncharacterized protein LOC123757966 [Procambarus clarkii]XP_045597929.1 uncharacterized protein LOC123757966 [Procambarus clarkii]